VSSSRLCHTKSRDTASSDPILTDGSVLRGRWVGEWEESREYQKLWHAAPSLRARPAAPATQRLGGDADRLNRSRPRWRSEISSWLIPYHHCHFRVLANAASKEDCVGLAPILAPTLGNEIPTGTGEYHLCLRMGSVDAWHFADCLRVVGGHRPGCVAE
jgi:hypothetical protein